MGGSKSDLTSSGLKSLYKPKAYVFLSGLLLTHPTVLSYVRSDFELKNHRNVSEIHHLAQSLDWRIREARATGSQSTFRAFCKLSSTEMDVRRLQGLRMVDKHPSPEAWRLCDAWVQPATGRLANAGMDAASLAEAQRMAKAMQSLEEAANTSLRGKQGGGGAGGGKKQQN